MYYGYIEYDDSIVIELQEEDLGDVITAVLYDNPDVFWVDYEYDYTVYDDSVSYSPRYRLTENEVKNMQDSVNDKIDEIMTELNRLDTDYEKELYIHDYIIENTVYDISTLYNLGDTVHSVLVSGKSICEGYSRTVQILLDKLGIENYLVVGETENNGKMESHMWNIVNIDGNNYHLDVTWDDLNDEFDTVYFYFNVTDDYILRDHYKINPQNNNCNSTESNYFVKGNAVVYTYKGYNNLIQQSVDALLKDNKVEFHFVDNTDYLNAVKDLENDNGFFTYVDIVVDKSKRKLNKNIVDYSTLDNHNYLRIEFKEG
ncbi:MAG: hypothetical protein J6B37_03630 [Clostridia bacterium]|nr:hypothetical protein [Clostridia bacterium]